MRSIEPGADADVQRHDRPRGRAPRPAPSISSPAGAHRRRRSPACGWRRGDRHRPAAGRRPRRRRSSRCGARTRTATTSASDVPTGRRDARAVARSSSSRTTSRSPGSCSRAPAGARLRRDRVADRPRRRDQPLSRGLRPDLVLLDINLPGETGWSVLRERRLRGGRTPAGRRRERHGGQPGPPSRVRRRRLSAQALRAGDASVDHRPLCSHGATRRMTDLQIVLLIAHRPWLSSGSCCLCERVGR